MKDRKAIALFLTNKESDKFNELVSNLLVEDESQFEILRAEDEGIDTYVKTGGGLLRPHIRAPDIGTYTFAPDICAPIFAPRHIFANNCGMQMCNLHYRA
jgi:hypothetical protein